mgnify:FL=1|jgi:hypothetical protein
MISNTIRRATKKALTNGFVHRANVVRVFMNAMVPFFFPFLDIFTHRRDIELMIYEFVCGYRRGQKSALNIIVTITIVIR